MGFTPEVNLKWLLTMLVRDIIIIKTSEANTPFMISRAIVMQELDQYFKIDSLQSARAKQGRK